MTNERSELERMPPGGVGIGAASDPDADLVGHLIAEARKALEAASGPTVPGCRDYEAEARAAVAAVLSALARVGDEGGAMLWGRDIMLHFRALAADLRKGKRP